MMPYQMSRTTLQPLLAGAVLLWAVAGGLAPVQGADPSGTEADRIPLVTGQDTLSTLDGVFNKEQASTGKQVYDVECSLCHGPSEFAGRLFQLTWTGQPLSLLYRHISTAMPLDNPGGLDREQYVAVLAYILEMNRYPSGERPLPSEIEELGLIVMDPPPAPDSAAAAAIHESSRIPR